MQAAERYNMPSTGENSGTAPVASACRRNWRQAFLERIYEGLIRADPIQPVDLIFVMAGRMNRKRYALQLYRRGVGPKLVLSVGRFEISKMSQTEFPFIDELIAVRSVTPSSRRHFFVSLDQSGTRVELASVPQWNTYGEVVGLKHYLEREAAAKIMVVSTGIHLRRTAYTISRVMKNQPCEILYCPVPDSDDLRKQSWWTRADSRYYVISEAIKLAGYTMILSMPTWVVGRLMRLKGWLDYTAVRVTARPPRRS